MAPYVSILSPQGGPPSGAVSHPDCLTDLHLDDVIAAVTVGHADDDVDQFFRVPLHDVSTVEHRHQVFRDLERDEIRRPVLAFVSGMRTMRHRRHRANELRHPLQRQGWFIHAVRTFCDTVTSLRDELARQDPEHSAFYRSFR